MGGAQWYGTTKVVEKEKAEALGEFLKLTGLGKKA